MSRSMNRWMMSVRRGLGAFGLAGLVGGVALCAQAQQADIFGGSSATPGAYPFQVSLVYTDFADNRRAHRCGATLISPRDVLTAGHCPVGGDVDPGNYQILYGTQHLNRGGTRVNIARVTLHPLYRDDSFNHDHDIAVIRLAQPITGITPVRYVRSLKQEAKVAPVGREGMLVGWGQIDRDWDFTDNPAQLQQASLPIMDRTACAQQPGYGEKLTDNMLCAGWLDRTTTACSGDSGGPLLMRMPGDASGPYTVQVGVVSWGLGCGMKNSPSVFARLGTLGQWVAQQVAKP